MEHHKYSPSKFPAWMECACFTGETIDEDDDSHAANKGTLQHEAHAKRIIGDHQWDVGLDAAQRRNVEYVSDRVLEIAMMNGYGPNEIRLENRVTLVDDDFNVRYFGTDDFEIGPIMGDAKYGLERDYFAQLCGYALAKMKKTGTSKVRYFVVYGMLRRVKWYVIDQETAQRVVDAVFVRILDPNKKPTPCQYCSMCNNKLNCRAYNSKVEALLPVGSAKLDLGDLAALPEAVRIGAQRYILKTYIEPWAEAVEASDVEPVGFKRSKKEGRVIVKDIAQAIDALAKAGVPIKFLQEALTTSTSKLIAAFRQHYQSASYEDAEKEVMDLLSKANCLVRGESYTVTTKQKDCEAIIRNEIAKVKGLK